MKINVNLKNKRWVSIVAASLLALAPTLGLADKLLLPLRGGESATSSLCDNSQACRILPNNTREFDNGNTFVRFEESVAGHDVLILFPKIVDPNQFMEGLIKIRTALTNAASSVQVVLPGKSLRDLVVTDRLGTPMKLPVEQLLATAGAQRIIFRGNQQIHTLHQKQVKLRLQVTGREMLIYGKQHPELTASLSRSMGIRQLSQIDGSESLRNSEVILVSPPVAPHNEGFLRGLSEAHRLVERGAKVHYFTPYLPYARSDKIDQPGITITGRLTSDMIEAIGVSSVAFVRAHAAQSQGFFRIPTLQFSGRPTINKFLQQHQVDDVVSPDTGFQKDAKLYADELKIPLSVINKYRDPKSAESKVVDISGPSLKGRRVAIIDDETASGSTLAQAAEFLKKDVGVTFVVAVVSHLTGSAAKALESPHIDAIAVTNTLPVSIGGTKLRVLDISLEIASEYPRILGNSCGKAVSK